MGDETTGPPETAAPARTERRRIPTGFATMRDVISFMVGMAIILNEVFRQESAEPTAVAIGVALTGLPLVFGADERRRGEP